MTTFELPKLPYAMDALEPHMSKETIEYHYGKHLQTYVTNLNNMIPGTKYENMTLEEIVLSSDGGVFNNAGQVMNHNLFFLQFTPKGQKAPAGELAKAIDRDFGSFDKFKEQFEKAAAGQFGSGWAWLVKDKAGKLSIVTTANGDNPITKGYTPILGLDVWEHSYYIDYRNRRADYIKAMWEIYDWDVVAQRFAK